MESRKSITRDSNRYMALRWTPALGEQGWNDGAWGDCAGAALMSREAAEKVAAAIPGATVAHEDEIFCDDEFGE